MEHEPGECKKRQALEEAEKANAVIKDGDNNDQTSNNEDLEAQVKALATEIAGIILKDKII